MFSGSRQIDTIEPHIVWETIREWVDPDTKVNVGCATGVDNIVVQSMIAMGLCQNLTIFAVGSWDGTGFHVRTSLPDIQRAEELGATVKWNAGGLHGGIRHKLMQRSIACAMTATEGVFILTAEQSPGTLNTLRYCLENIDGFKALLVPCFVPLPKVSGFVPIRIDDHTYRYAKDLV
jgi:hypothetical protein